MKKTLVIIPGWGGSGETWGDFIKKASGVFEVVCIDLPCFGGVPCPVEAWGVSEYADYVFGKISALGKKPEEIILLGHSFGGQVAVRMLGEHPGTVGTLVLSGAAVFRMKASVRRLVFGTVAKAGKLALSVRPFSYFESMGKKMLYRVADSPDYLNTEGVEKEIFKKVIREDVSHYLPTIKTPTLLIWGNRDRYVPVSRGKRMLKKMPNARLEIIPKATHGIHLSHAERVIELIKNFRP